LVIEDELSKLKMIAESVKIKLEAGNQQLLFSPEELANPVRELRSLTVRSDGGFL